jgi:hypothetical protein
VVSGWNHDLWGRWTSDGTAYEAKRPPAQEKMSPRGKINPRRDNADLTGGVLELFLTRLLEGALLRETPAAEAKSARRALHLDPLLGVELFDRIAISVMEIAVAATVRAVIRGALGKR